MASPLAERTKRDFECVDFVFYRRVGNGSSAGANGGIGRDEESMKRREGEDKGRGTRTRRCALGEEQWSDRANSTREIVLLSRTNPAFRTS